MEVTIPNVIYLMGPPGAGKDTQAKMLASEIGFSQFSTGATLRALAAKDTDLGRTVKNIMGQGLLCPPELVAQIVIEAVKEHLERGEKLVFDGTPRTMQEATIVDEFFVKGKYGRPLAIFLEIAKETMIGRNSKRRMCTGIQSPFLVFSDEDEQKCLALGGKITARPDDDPSKFETRWNEFMEQTWPVVEKYRHEGILHVIDGERSVAEVHTSIVELFEELYSTKYKHDFPEN